VSFPELSRLLAILERLRGPDGCPWDRKQTLASAARFLADEVHEYADAAIVGDLEESRAELADLLYMVCFNWLLLSEQAPGTFDAVAGAGADKLVRRHPHVFGTEQALTAEDSQILWNRIKAQERRGEPARAAPEGGPGTGPTGAGETAPPGPPPIPPPSVLKDLSPSTSPLRQAFAYGSSAAEFGFDWPDAESVHAKLGEELQELQEVWVVRTAQAAGQRANALEELGDVLFTVTQLARKLDIDPDAALRVTNAKFARRFRRVEAEQGFDAQQLRAMGRQQLAAAWRAAKELDAAERAAHAEPTKRTERAKRAQRMEREQRAPGPAQPPLDPPSGQPSSSRKPL
jgi:ATP diphosphatase